MTKIRPFWTHVFVFVLGLSIGIFSFTSAVSLDIEFPVGGYSEIKGPFDRISEKDVHVYEDKIIISVSNPRWARIADTKSMAPVLDYGSYALQIVPLSPSELAVGDIISFRHEDIVIIHRIVEIGFDGEWYAYTKGDNNSQKDPFKVRFSSVEKVLIGILY